MIIFSDVQEGEENLYYTDLNSIDNLSQPEVPIVTASPQSSVEQSILLCDTIAHPLNKRSAMTAE